MPREYDLDERTAKFGEAVIAFARKVPVDPVTRRLIETKQVAQEAKELHLIFAKIYRSSS